MVAVIKVLNLGSLNLDYIYSVSHFVRAGETLASTEMNVFCGGKGFNQSLAIRKSGCEVWHAGAVGESDSNMLLETLNANGVFTDYISKKTGSSGHAIIQREVGGQNCILLYGGANQRITKEEIDEVLKQFEAGDYLIAQNEISETAYLLEKAHERGMITVFNPSPMDARIKHYPLEKVDYLILNEIEGKELCDSQEAMEEETLIERLAQQFENAKIILTLGERGAIYKDHKTTLFQEAYKVKVVDTTGAGDTFTGFFIGSLVAGKSVQLALEYAAKAAALAVTKEGAGPSIPQLNEVKECQFISCK